MKKQSKIDTNLEKLYYSKFVGNSPIVYKNEAVCVLVSKEKANLDTLSSLKSVSSDIQLLLTISNKFHTMHKLNEIKEDEPYILAEFSVYLLEAYMHDFSGIKVFFIHAPGYILVVYKDALLKTKALLNTVIETLEAKSIQGIPIDTIDLKGDID